MDDIIVLILTLIFIVAGIFGQIKKRQLPAGTEEEPRERQPQFWEIFENEKELPEEEEVHLVPEEEGGRGDRFHTAASMMKREFTPKVSEIIEEKPKTVLVDLNDFSLKKAVIYSEILNRKYF